MANNVTILEAADRFDFLAKNSTPGQPDLWPGTAVQPTFAASTGDTCPGMLVQSQMGSTADTATPFDAIPFDPTIRPATQPVIDRYVSGEGLQGAAESGYNIELVFQGEWSSQQQATFTRAADYISSIIQGDLSDTGGVDDLRITAEMKPIDGQNGILAYAGPTGTRPDGLSYEGQMTFDSNDTSIGTFGDVVLHEMMHCVGIGTLWGDMTSGSTGAGDMRFTGQNATEAYKALFPDIAGTDPNADMGVPIETDGASGTAGSHWDEETFNDEIMTGYINGSNTFTGMTAAALEDMGYDTIFDAASPDAAMPPMGLDDPLLA